MHTGPIIRPWVGEPIANSPTTYLGLPAQGYLNQGVIGIVQSDIRGEKSGLDNSYLSTLFVQHEYKPTDKLSLSQVPFTGKQGLEKIPIYILLLMGQN